MTAYMGCIGDDAFGRKLAKACEEDGVLTRWRGAGGGGWRGGGGGGASGAGWEGSGGEWGGVGGGWGGRGVGEIAPNSPHSCPQATVATHQQTQA